MPQFNFLPLTSQFEEEHLRRLQIVYVLQTSKNILCYTDMFVI